MDVPTILSYVTALLRDWGIMPYIQVVMLILSVVTAIVFIRRLGTGS